MMDVKQQFHTIRSRIARTQVACELLAQRERPLSRPELELVERQCREAEAWLDERGES